jgi:trans-aconitate methyltransferase
VDRAVGDGGRFDADYYGRFYGSRPVHTRRRIATLASGVDGMCRWWGIDVRRVLDVGAGPGWWRDWYRRERPSVTVHSVDVSEHACRRWGHERRDISQWAPTRPYDLVICHGVLHYMDDADAARAIGNLAAACRGAMYLEAPTARDLDEVVDRDVTDMDVHARSGSWYARRLRRHFRRAGAGLWLSRRSGVALYELESAGD